MRGSAARPRPRSDRAGKVSVRTSAPVATPILAAAAQAYVESYAGVSGEQWDRPGVRSNGSEFTVLTLGQYGLHDLAHHLWDVRAGH